MKYDVGLELISKLKDDKSFSEKDKNFLQSMVPKLCEGIANRPNSVKIKFNENSGDYVLTIGDEDNKITIYGKRGIFEISGKYYTEIGLFIYSQEGNRILFYDKDAIETAKNIYGGVLPENAFELISSLEKIGIAPDERANDMSFVEAFRYVDKKRTDELNELFDEVKKF